MNTRTGEVKVLRFVAAQDSGRVMNELTYENQMQGGITMGLGLALTEERILDREPDGQDGEPQLARLQDPDRDGRAGGPDGACRSTCTTTRRTRRRRRGSGEPATIPTAPAIANAIYHACGVRTPDTPVNPTRLMDLLAAAKKRG